MANSHKKCRAGDSALGKGSSACRGLAKIDFYALAVSNSTCLRKSFGDKERIIKNNREIPRKTLSIFKSNSCPFALERIKCNH